MYTYSVQDTLHDKPGLSHVSVTVIYYGTNSTYCLKFKGEQLGTAEATDTFFAMTRLFQSRDIILRRMVYLGIKVKLL